MVSINGYKENQSARWVLFPPISDANVIANPQLVKGAERHPLLADAVAVQVADHAFFKAVIPVFAVITVFARDVNIRVGHRLVKIFYLEPRFNVVRYGLNLIKG